METKTTAKQKTIQVIDLGERAKSLTEIAINEARLKMPKVYDELDLPALMTDVMYIENLKIALANLVAEEIADNDPSVEKIYAFNPELNPGSHSDPSTPIDLSIHMLCVVEKSSAAVNALISSLDRGIAAAIRELPTNWYNQLETVLDVIIISNKDIQERKGYATLLSSVYAPPLRIWP